MGGLQEEYTTINVNRIRMLRSSSSCHDDVGLLLLNGLRHWKLRYSQLLKGTSSSDLQNRATLALLYIFFLSKRLRDADCSGGICVGGELHKESDLGSDSALVGGCALQLMLLESSNADQAPPLPVCLI